MSISWKEFLKAQLSAFIGGLTDFCIYSLAYKIFLLSAPLSNVISGGIGAVVNFSINRSWSFSSSEKPIASQLWKFVIVVIGSIFLKTVGIYFLVDVHKFHFLLSKLIVEIIVSLGFNFTFQKFWVFKK